MKTAIVLCALAASALAAPSTRTTRLDPALSDHVRLAELAWTAAEAEVDPEKDLPLWESAATAFGEVDGDAAVKREAARAAKLAWNNAAIAANLLLDAYNRAQQYDKLIALANQLAKDAKLLRDHDDLASIVHRIQRQALRKGADGRKGDDAGAAYLELYNAAPESPDGDELLYNAAVSFETAHSIGRAIDLYGRIRKQYPNSKLGSRALARQGKLYGEIAFYDKAAEKLEEYATKYAGEKDAYDAMSDAVYFRKAVGDRAKAIEDTKYFVKTFTPRQPRAAADAMWSLTSLYDGDPDLAIAQLREYLTTFGAKGGADRVAIAHARIGLLLWAQSCSVPLFDGLCAKANERTPRTCGTGTTRTLTAIARDARKVRAANEAFAAATAAYQQQHVDAAAARYYLAQTRLATADAQLESFLALALPRSAQELRAWLEEEQRVGGSASNAYAEVLAIKDAASSIDAADRIAIVAQSFASRLVTLKVKPSCDAMLGIAAPLEVRAVEGFEVCLAKSTELGWWGAASARCERELAHLRPDEWPRAIEVRAQPSAAPVFDLEPAAQ